MGLPLSVSRSEEVADALFYVAEVTLMLLGHFLVITHFFSSSHTTGANVSTQACAPQASGLAAL